MGYRSNSIAYKWLLLSYVIPSSCMKVQNPEKILFPDYSPVNDNSLTLGRKTEYNFHVDGTIAPVKLGSKSVTKFLSLADEHFLREVADDIKCFLSEKNANSVLLFPPLSNFRRLLIHKCIEDENSDLLGTFSIGLGDDRRTVICYKDKIICLPSTSQTRMGYEGSVPLSQNSSEHGGTTNGRSGGMEIYRPPAQRHQAKSLAVAEQIRASRTKQRRPDREVYVPRAKRVAADVTNLNAKREGFDPTIKEDKVKHHTPVRKSLDRNYCNVYTPPHLRKKNDSDVLNSGSDVSKDVVSLDEIDNSDFSVRMNLDYTISDFAMADKVCTNDQRLEYSKDDEDKELIPEEINRSNRRILRPHFSPVLVISDPVLDNSVVVDEIVNDVEANSDAVIEKAKLSPRVSLKREENDWEAVFDESGDCLDPSLLEELTATVGKVHISKAKNNYEQYQTKGQLMLSGPCDETFGHVVEVYNFPSEFKTNDLLSIFSDYKDTGFEIKWVDDTHALIVFSSSKIAAEVMSTTHPIVKTRPLHEATLESRQKAKKCAEFLQPYRQRPETCASLARRLVTGALGLRPTADSDHEKNIIRMAREKKKQAALHKEAAWNGSLTSQNCENT